MLVVTSSLEVSGPVQVAGNLQLNSTGGLVVNAGGSLNVTGQVVINNASLTLLGQNTNATVREMIGHLVMDF